MRRSRASTTSCRQINWRPKKGEGKRGWRRSLGMVRMPAGKMAKRIRKAASKMLEHQEKTLLLRRRNSDSIRSVIKKLVRGRRQLQVAETRTLLSRGEAKAVLERMVKILAPAKAATRVEARAVAKVEVKVAEKGVGPERKRKGSQPKSASWRPSRAVAVPLQGKVRGSCRGWSLEALWLRPPMPILMLMPMPVLPLFPFALAVIRGCVPVIFR
mmetsp:Transcript_40803/g.80571  ORF Transcript_40803/g.80571 Transcript_40803/m.80571 type:complete len:214 (+) Transcript_40803:1019-1660(+)